MAAAARTLGDALDGPAPVSAQGRTLLLEALIVQLVTASRHREALERARALEAHVRIARAPRLWVDVLAFCVRVALGAFTRRPSFRRALAWALHAGRLKHGATASSIRAVQLAYYWYDIRACRRLSLLQLALSRKPHEVRRALAWLGYTYGYAGDAAMGFPLIRHALASAHRDGDEATLVETYPLLAIACHACDRPLRALHYHALYQRRYASKSAFYRLLSQTNLLVALASLGRFADLKAPIETCFSLSFGLDASRHHLQIYGIRAVLLAVEGHAADAAKALALAENAAQRNDSTLDWTIYHRLAALTFVVARDFGRALECADRGLAHCAAYGRARWYERELRELRAIALGPGTITAYRARLLEASNRYLSEEVRRQREETADWKLSQLAEQLAEALRSHVEFDPSRPPSVDDLRTKLERTFKTDTVVIARDLAELKATALRDIAHLSLTTESNGELRLGSADGRFFLGLECDQTSEFREALAAGVFLRGVDPLSESLVKAAFRLVLAQYVFVHSIRISRELQAKQQRAAAIGALAQMLAHDVRRPFCMIRTAIDVLLRACEGDAFRKQAALVLAEVQMAADTADGLIADVLEVSHVSPRAAPEPVAPDAIIAAAMIETLRAYPAADVRFEYDLRHRTAIHADPKKVQRVVSNILSNAIQAMDHRGSITISTSHVVQAGRDFVSFVIGNDGPPIPDEDVPTLFDPFFTRNKPTGTGLGLAIVHRVITAHGGTVQCLPTGGRGAAFAFTLPSAGTPAAASRPLPARSGEVAALGAMCPEPPPSSHPDKLPEVAIVDDSRAFLMGWRGALTGCAVGHFFIAPEAFWTAIETDTGLLARLSAVVTDYTFANSRHTGVSFARALKERRPDVPIVMSSAGYVSPRETAGVIDGELDKDAVSWAALSAALRESVRRLPLEAP